MTGTSSARRRAVAALTAALVAATMVVGLAGAAAAKSEARDPSTASSATTKRSKSPTTTTTVAPTTTTTEAPTVTAPAPVLGLRRAALRITIMTTSDWAQVDLPGVSSGHVVVANAQARQVQPTAKGVVVRGPLGTYGSVTIDVVTEVPQSFEQGGVTLSQGGGGSTSIAVQNRTTDLVGVTSINTSPSLTRKSVAVTDDSLLAGQQLEWARADDERRVLAFTYPWFGQWSLTAPNLSVHPTYASDLYSLVDSVAMATQARSHGIDGFVMSFSGGARHGLPLHLSLEAAAATGGTATILLETTEAGTPEVAEQWLREALRQSAHPAFLRVDGVPVVFAFEGAGVSGAQWKVIGDRLAAEGTPVKVVADFWPGANGPVTGMYRYNSLLDSPVDEMTEPELTAWNQGIARTMRAKATLGAGEPGLVVATAQPGWDDRLIRGADRLTVPWSGTSTYDRTWRAALAGEPDWVVVTSWNEWYEGTGIAPSAEHGTAALEATKSWAGLFGG